MCTLFRHGHPGGKIERVMDEHIAIRTASEFIRKRDLEKLDGLYHSVIHAKLDHAYILQKSYLNACAYGTPEIIRYFFQLAHTCSEIDKIRIRHAFTHSKYTIRNFSHVELDALISRLYPRSIEAV